MKKILISLLLFFSLFLSGCSDRTDELGKNSIVTTIYTDYKNNHYTFYAENLSFSSYSNEKEENSSLIYSQGVTPFEAWENLKRNFSQAPYFGHTRAVVMGDGILKKGCKEILYFLMNESSLPTNASVFFTSKDPKSFKAFALSEAIGNKTIPIQSSYLAFYPENAIFDIPFLEEKSGHIICDSAIILNNFNYDFTVSNKDFHTFALLKNRNYDKIYDTFEITFSKAKIKDNNINLLLSLNFVSPYTEDFAKKQIEKNICDFINTLSKENKLYILSKNIEKPSISIKTTQKRVSRLKAEGIK